MSSQRESDPEAVPATAPRAQPELTELFALSRDLAEVDRFPRLFEILFAHLPRLVEYDVAAVLLQDDDERTMFLDSARQLAPGLQQQIVSQLEEGRRKMGGGPSTGDLEIQRIRDESQGADPPIERLGSHFLVPIFDLDRSPRAVLLLASGEPDRFSEEQLKLVNLVAHQAATPLIRLEQLRKRQQRLLAAIVEHLPAGVVLLDGAGRIRLENPRARELLDVLGTEPGARQVTVIGDLEVDGWLTAREPDGDVQKLTHKLSALDEDEEERFFELEGRPIPGVGPSSDPDWLLLIRDVTREHHEQQLALSQARQLALAQVTAGMAHEFNNLLTSIVGTAGLLEDEPLSDEGREDLAIVLSEGRRAADLVRKLLDYARSSVVSHGPGDLSEVVAEAEREQKAELPGEYELRLSVEDGRYPMEEMNPSQLRQMVGNAVENSVEAMPGGGTVELSLRRRNGETPEAVLTIRDSGVGMTPGEQGKAFQPFFTTKGPSRSGLGLAQVQGIVREHGGEVTLEAEPDQGTTLTISLPLSDDRP